MSKRAVVLAEGLLGTIIGKTANILVMYNRRLFEVVAIIDNTHAGSDAGEVLGLGRLGIPVVSTIEEAIEFGPEALIVGVATIGGVLPERCRVIIREAIKHGLEIWSGLHYFLSEDPEFSELASRYNVRIVDVRKPPKDKLRIWSGDVLKTRCGRVLVAGTDCAVGKNVTVLELSAQLVRRGYKAGIVATGQTMILAGAHAGMVVDAIPSDFCPGIVERLILDLDREGYNPVMVEGQASLLHPAYGQVSLAILYGCMPDAVVLAHDPWRKNRGGMRIPMDSIEREIEAIEFLARTAKVIAIAVMGCGRERDEVIEMCDRLEKDLGLPVADPRIDPGKLAEAVIKRLHELGKI